jgi:protocatechuate 3,4-dioxygenase alpha subunit
VTLAPTPSQTVGPFFHIGTDDGFIGNELVAPDRPGALRLVGTVRDGEGVPVIDAMIEIWQANAAGRYAHPEARFRG